MLNFTHIKNMNVLLKQCSVITLNCRGFSYLTFKSMSVLFERKLLSWSDPGKKKEPFLSSEFLSITVTLPLSLHHFINFCPAARVAPIIFLHAECDLKLADGLNNYVLFKQGQHVDSEPHWLQKHEHRHGQKISLSTVCN